MGELLMSSSPKTAVCAGTFDVLTNGHVDVITRAARLFDRLIVGVLVNPDKQPWFSPEERMETAREVFAGVGNVTVDAFDGLLVEYVRAHHVSAVVRGLRTTSEFNDEWQMALMNQHLLPAFETVFLMPSPAVAYISSRLVKEIALHGGAVSGLVPRAVATRIARRHATARPLEA